MMGNIVSELSIVRSLYLVSVFWKVLGQKQGKLLCVKDQDGLLPMRTITADAW